MRAALLLAAALLALAGCVPRPPAASAPRRLAAGYLGPVTILHRGAAQQLRAMGLPPAPPATASR